MYLSPEEFDLKYPVGDYISKGVFGAVYRSNDHVIKIGLEQDTIEGNYQTILSEINVYSRVDHPCIAKLENWTLTPTEGKLALPYGESISQAYQDGKISFDELVGDLLSAEHILNKIGVAHNDIKLANVIFKNGHAQLIDFGIISNVLRYLDQDVIENPKYTYTYRDPQIDFETTTAIGRPINAKIEMYAIGMTVLAIIYGESMIEKINDYPFYQHKKYSKLTPEQEEIIHDLMLYPVKDRLLPKAILEKYPQLRFTTGTLLETPVLPDRSGCNQQFLNVLFPWVVNVFGVYKSNKARTLFNTIHMIHRCLNVILPDYATVSTQRMKIQLLATCCIFLSQVALNDDHIISFKKIVYVSNNAYTIEEVKDMVALVSSTLRGILVTPTPWDYAEKFVDLLDYFLDMLICYYDPSQVRPPNTTITSKYIDKNQSVSSFIPLFRKHININYEHAIMSNVPNKLIPSEIRPSMVEFTDKPSYNLSMVKHMIYAYNRSGSDENIAYHMTNHIFKVLDQITDPDDIIQLRDMLDQTTIGREILKYFP
jgi:serine/threonine protein kinase